MLNKLTKTLNHQDYIRIIVQILFFVFLFILVAINFLIENKFLNGTPLKDLHGICPFGGVASLGRLLFEGEFIAKTSLTNIFSLLAVIITTLLLGPVFCGWLCPLGSIQEWVDKLGQHLFKKRYNNLIPPRLDRWLSLLRYLVLALIIYFTTKSLSLVFSRVDPFYALFHFWIGQAFPVAIIVLAFVLLLSLIEERPWCRWFCPLGALNGLLGMLAPFTIKRQIKICNSCKLCSKSCPFNIRLDNIHNLASTRCIRCLRCTNLQMKKECLNFGLKGTAFNFKRPITIVILILVLFFLPIAAGRLYTSLSTSSASQTTFTLNNISPILSLEELAKGLKIETDMLLNILQLPADTDLKTKLRDLEEIDEKLTTPNIKKILQDHLHLNQDP